MNPQMPESHLAKRPDVISFGVVVGHVGLVLAPVYLATWLPLWSLPLCWLAFGFLMNGLLNLMHEAAHFHVFRHRKANDWLGRWILGPLAVPDIDTYRQRHWDHHRHLGQPEDPKLTYLQDIRGGRIWAYGLRCLCLIEAARKFRHQFREHNDEPTPGSSLRFFFRTLTFQTVWLVSLFGVALLDPSQSVAHAALRASLAYGLVYVYGLGSLSVLAASIRAIAEHQVNAPDEIREGVATFRNFSCNVIMRLCFDAYGFAEHATHHLHPAVPYYNLRQTTTAFAAKHAHLSATRGYLGTIYLLIRRSTPSASVPGSNRSEAGDLRAPALR